MYRSIDEEVKIIMRILFFLSGTIWGHTLPEGFIEAGHQVKITGPLNKQTLPKIISEFKPDLSISIGWGQEQTIENQFLIRKCSKESKIPHVYWSIEDPAFTWTFSLPLIQRVQPDFVFSLCAQRVEYYKRMGIKAAHMDFGFAPKIHHNVQCEENYKSSIAIVANGYPDVLRNYPDHYRHDSIQTLICPLLKENIRIDFWGRHWDKVKPFIKYDIPSEWIHGYLPYKDANKVYSSSTIMLGLQNYPTQLTQRTYEILASGGFLLTSDTPEVRRLYEPGKELIVSSSPEETLELVEYYLNNPDECRKIAKVAQLKVEGNSYKHRAEYMLSILKDEKIL